METSVVCKKLFAGVFHLRAVSTGRSPVWSTIAIVTDSDKNDLDYTACKSYYQTYTYKGFIKAALLALNPWPITSAKQARDKLSFHLSYLSH